MDFSSSKAKKTGLIIVSALVILVALSWYAIRSVQLQGDINQKKVQLSELEQVYSSVQAENDEMEKLLAEGTSPENIDKNMEKVAREKYSYVNPNERVYYVDSYE